MKNKHYDRLRESAKRYRKQAKNDSRWNHELGIKVYHVYYPEGHPNYREKTYWDDVAFIRGSQQVTVWWTHPRYQYSETVDDQAYKEACEKYPDRVLSNPFKDSVPTYKYLGKNKNRKRVAFWTLKTETPDEFYPYWRQRREELCKTSDYVQKAKFEVKQYDYCRGVEICIPVEVRGEADLKTLCDFVNKCLDNPEHFSQTYGSYQYTKEDWNKENPDGEVVKFVDHGVNL